MQSSEELKLKASLWLESDPDSKTRAQVANALKDSVLLRQLFENPLRFGTAGLRGKRGPGPGGINFLTILRVSWAISRLVKARGLSAAPLLVGFDARHQAQPFAQAAARLLRAQGLKVLLAPAPTPTPLIAFGARKYTASCALVFTASHNPKDDSGLKVYDDRGVQIVAPWDAEIEQLSQIAPTSLRDLDLISLATEMSDLAEFTRLESDYLAYLQSLALSYKNSVVGECRGETRTRSLGYTPLSGVGGTLTARHFDELNQLRSVAIKLVPVAEQLSPDPDFPDIPFPNPEVEETLSALKLLLAQKKLGAGIAQDPDADRFLLVFDRFHLQAPFYARSDERYLSFSGDDMGLLLAHLSLKQRPQSQRSESFVVSSIVSSPAIESVAQLHGARSERTLTGFKWIARAALAASGFAFGYEEALGYLFAPGAGDQLLEPQEISVADKDGIAATAVMGQLLSDAGPEALLNELLNLQQQVGVWQSVQLSIPLDPMMNVKELLGEFQTRHSIQGLQLMDFINFEDDVESRSPLLGKQTLLSVRVKESETGENITALLRPSGTEPKLKLYVHLLSAKKPQSWEQWLELRRELSASGMKVAHAFKETLLSFR